MSHTYISALFHCVFSTKDRAPLISVTLAKRLFPYMGGIAREHDIKLLEIGGIENHVHFLISLPSVLSVAKAMQLIKGGSSKWVHETFDNEYKEFAWQEGYGAFSIGVSQFERTGAYIRNQEVHHQEKSFEQEFRAILQKHWISYDEEHVFG